MSELTQIIYSSAAVNEFSPQEIQDLLAQSREKNARLFISGMLLFVDGSFFQILEGETEAVEQLYNTICNDPRHANITVILHEPIAKRLFSEWSMGYADLSGKEADAILETNDFFTKGESFTSLSQSRAKKLLHAFKEGRWRSRLTNSAIERPYEPTDPLNFQNLLISAVALPKKDCLCTFAFQPIINVSTKTIFSYEALIRGHDHESVSELLSHVKNSNIHQFDANCRIQAIKVAASLGIDTHLNLNVLPESLQTLPQSIDNILDTAKACGIFAEQIVIEILEHEFIENPERFASFASQYRSAGLLFAIDDFGSGYAGLNLLADFQPDFIKLDMNLVRGINRKGARQAIVRGIIRTCFDLGIDIIAEGVESEAEYEWLHNEGINLFQGFLFARPEFEYLPKQFLH